MIKSMPLNEFLFEYTERNIDNKYRPVAVGRYGIRSRDSIYSKELAKDYSKNKLIFKNTLTIGMGSVQIDIGILSTDETYSVSPAYHTYRINNINPNYLRYCLECRNQDMFVRYVKKGSRQGKTIDLSRWLTYEIPVYSIEDQEKIVDKIDRVQGIIDASEKQLVKLDELVKSRFVEMFGDLVQGDRISTNRRKIGEIASVTKLAGFEFTKYIHYKDKEEKDDVIMLRGLNCKNGHLILDDIKWIDKGTSDILPRSKLYAGDILMTYAGTIGDVALVDADDKYHLAPNVGKITLADKKKYNPVFVIHLFMYSHDYIMTFASQVAQASINMKKIRNFEFFFPETEQQNRFAAFVAEVDKSKLAVKQSLEKLETLKKSLMQQYFG